MFLNYIASGQKWFESFSASVGVKMYEFYVKACGGNRICATL